MSTSMRAVVVQADKTVKVQRKLIPIPKPNELLIKVITASLNPTDWKHAVYLTNPGTISGCDFAGTVVEIGKDVPAGKVSIGQFRGGFTRGGYTQDNGAFAEYVTTPWHATFVAPKNLTPQQVASITIPLFTGVQGLHFTLGIPNPGEDNSRVAGKWLLVWSGATAVGQYAIQLGKIAGMKVATTSSPKNNEKLKAFGADVIIDYKDPEVVEKLKAATSNGIIYAIDCISLGDSPALVQKAFGPEGGSGIAVLFNSGELPRSDVKLTTTLLYTTLGEDHGFGPDFHFKASKEDTEHHAKWQITATELFESGKLKPLETIDFGGLESVQEAMNQMQNGTIPGKVAFTI